MKHIPVLNTPTLTIPDEGTQSDSVDVSLFDLAGVQFPASMAGTGITFQVSQDNSTFTTVYQGSGDLTLTKQNNKLVLFTAPIAGLGKYLRIVSQASETSGPILFKLYLVPRAR